MAQGVLLILWCLPIGSYLVPLGAFLFLDLPVGSVLLAAIAEGLRFGPSQLSFLGIGNLELILFTSVFYGLFPWAPPVTRGGGPLGLLLWEAVRSLCDGVFLPRGKGSFFIPGQGFRRPVNWEGAAGPGLPG